MAFRMTELLQKVLAESEMYFNLPSPGRCLFQQIQGWPERPVTVSFLSLRLRKRASVTPLSMPLNMKRKAYRIALLCMYTLHKSYSPKIFPSIPDLRSQRMHCSHIEPTYLNQPLTDIGSLFVRTGAPTPPSVRSQEKRWVGMPVEIQETD